MKEVALKVNSRSTGKKGAKAVRNSGLVPGIYYTKGEAPIAISAEPLSLRPIVYTALTKIINLELEGRSEALHCVLKDVTFDPVTDAIVHFDFLGIKPGQKLTVEVPVVAKGTSPGVRAGGNLQQAIHKLKVTCIPADLPETIEVNISELKMGGTIHLADVATQGLEFEIPLSTALVQCVVPRTGTVETEAKSAE